MIIYFEFINSVFAYILDKIPLIIFTGLALYINYLLIDTTKKWLTTGLSKNEKEIVGIIFKIVLFLGLLFGIAYLPYLFMSTEKVPFFVLRNLIGSYFVACVYWIFFKILFTSFTIEKKYFYFIYFFYVILSITTSIIIDYFLGDLIVSWFISYWHYLLGVLFLTSIIWILYDNYKKKNQPLN